MKKIIYSLILWAIFLIGMALLAMTLYEMYQMIATSGYQQ